MKCIGRIVHNYRPADFTFVCPTELGDLAVCPAKWEEGEDTLSPSLDLVGKI